MLKKEQRYEFRKRLMELHKPNIRNYDIVKAENEFEIKDNFSIILPENYDVITKTAAYDFSDYLLTSMNVCAGISKSAEDNYIKLSVNENIEEASGYMGYRINVTEKGITIEGYDSRGIAQGLYFLEDLMNIKKAPIVPFGTIKRKAEFDIMRATQSPMGTAEFPDEILARIAHLGMDTLEMWMTDFDSDRRGYYLDLENLAQRAAKYGIKILVQFYIPHSVNVFAPNAEEFYDNIYGKLFRECPSVWGVSFLGEATRYATSDPHIAPPGVKKFERIAPRDTRPTSSGWWPCNDYPDLMKLILKIIKGIKPEAELVISTYNWQSAPDEERVRLIKDLPKECIIMTTWDNGRKYRLGEESVECGVDYSLRFAEPSEKYKVEAEAVKKAGLRGVSNANSSGFTWDFGMIPYEPMPFQWMKKYNELLKAKRDYGLSGMLENIHYGFYPSIITDIEKWKFFTPVKEDEAIIRDLIVRDYGEENADLVESAFRDLSEAITHYVATNEDQYGPYRIGPAYPIWTDIYEGWPKTFPSHSKHAAHPLPAMAYSRYWEDLTVKNSLIGIRLFDELDELDKMLALVISSLSTLNKCENPNEELLRLTNLVHYIRNCIITTKNVKEHYINRQQLTMCRTREKGEELIRNMEEILKNELENVKDTIPLVQCDSRLGWEPSMEYVGDEKALLWKIEQVEVELIHLDGYFRHELFWDRDNI